MIPKKKNYQNARSLAGQHLLLKELIQDTGYNCIYAFSETWLSKNHPEEFWHIDKQNFVCFRKDCIQTTKTKCGGIILYIPKLLKLRLRDGLNLVSALRVQILKIYELSRAYKKAMRFKFIILSQKKLVEMFLEKLVLGTDLDMVEGKSVVVAGDYSSQGDNRNYFAKRDRILIQLQ